MSQWLAERTASVLESRTSRRSFIVRTALAGSALTVAPLRFLLRPVTAYAAICGCAGSTCDCGSLCCDGYTDFCCTINNGVNACPPGTFAGGWWKVDSSGFCTSGGQRQPRYYIDCHHFCAKCTTGCGGGVGTNCSGRNPFCSSGCVNCSCGCANGNCANRRVCCNYFRYGQCHQEIACSGPVTCRVVSCTPPYLSDSSCTSTTCTDNATATHTAACVGNQPPPPPPPSTISEEEREMRISAHKRSTQVQGHDVYDIMWASASGSQATAAGRTVTVVSSALLVAPESPDAGPCQITLFIGGVNAGNHTVQPGSTAFPIYRDGRISVIDLNNRGLLVEYERLVA